MAISQLLGRGPLYQRDSLQWAWSWRGDRDSDLSPRDTHQVSLRLCFLLEGWGHIKPCNSFIISTILSFSCHGDKDSDWCYLNFSHWKTNSMIFAKSWRDVKNKLVASPLWIRGLKGLKESCKMNNLGHSEIQHYLLWRPTHLSAGAESSLWQVNLYWCKGWLLLVRRSETDVCFHCLELSPNSKWVSLKVVKLLL